MDCKISSAKWWQFYLALKALMVSVTEHEGMKYVYNIVVTVIDN